VPLQAGQISSTMPDFIGFIKRATPAINHQSDNYTFLKLRNQLRAVTLNNKVKFNLALIGFVRSRICAPWRVMMIATYWMQMAAASSSG
jgi:hypothetical protein